ncbi:hypothetical protein LTS14_003452 [Recurvomyces mirabilis]|uniref:uncharacterized protein n=1 Tax=Recurvomyces mirabilis TaxID=574656 RepID=UPI002DE1ADB0|nr:hypothetical protein LTS14_003452 [Recurvomyces mirabilis]
MLLSFLFALSAFASVAFTNPLPLPEISIQSIKRSEAGPEISGANFPDPAIIKVGSTCIHIQVASSPDFTTWNIINKSDGTQFDALPNLPAWVDASNPATWAPDVNQMLDGTFVMYYSATAKADPSKHCVGAAKSSTVTGPYTPIGSAAFICPLSQGGAIDASGYYVGGKRYVTWKIDGNSLGHGGACSNMVAPIVTTPIMVQQVGNDGVSFIGAAKKIMDNDGVDDQGVVEAPSLVKIGSTWVLFFSSGCFVSTYNQTYATASSIMGPYTRATKPLFYNGVDGLTNPGGGDIQPDGTHLVFHANAPSGRAMFQATVSLNGRAITA